MAKKEHKMNKMAKASIQPATQSAGMSESYKAEFAAEHNVPNLKKKPASDNQSK